MADINHLQIIEKGPDVWDEWRRENPNIKPDLSNADLRRLDAISINFVDVNLTGTDLYKAKLMTARLTRAKLVDTILRKADLVGAYLGGADFTRADLRATDLVAANLSGAIFSQTRMSKALIGGTTFEGSDLSVAYGLDAVYHLFASHISIDTIYQSKGNIPESFLRGLGVPDNFITYISSLTGKAFEYYKCFISFTEADELFAERLYNDLQGAGIRCWRWKEDAKWGKTLMHSIDEAIRTYDKLLVICSEQSLKSPAVIREIERALQKEDELARKGESSDVLFPIRIDDYILDGWDHYRRADVLSKNIGDFRQWKNLIMYRKSFGRLIRDLNTKDGAACRDVAA